VSAQTGSRPGTWETRIVVWNVADPAKAGDPHFWWSADEVGWLLRTSAPGDASRLVRAGMPKGKTLAELRKEAGGNELRRRIGGPPSAPPDNPNLEVDLDPSLWGPPHTVCIPLDPWRDADPQRTRFLISHTWNRPPGLPSPVRHPEHVERLRQAWIEALKTGDESARSLREQLDEEMEAIGGFVLRPPRTWTPSKAVEIAPRILVRDDRPAA
jgi:hypothetical protein